MLRVKNIWIVNNLIYNIAWKRKMVMNKYLEIIEEFIDKMGYRDNTHYLGTYFYGSSLTGYNNSASDIDLHIVFDNSNR